MGEILLLMPVILLIHTSAGVSTNERSYKALKFGETSNDYILFQPDMGPFETGFTACAWIRKLYSYDAPTWLSYAVSEQYHEIQVGDDGRETFIFGVSSDLTSVYTVSPGTWFLNCLGWDAASQTRNVYIDGRLVDSKATPAGRTLRQGGSLLLGNEQDAGPGAGMDSSDIFGGEMFKMNMFSRKLNDSEIKEMAKERCSMIEEQKYDEVRVIKWEDILKKKRTGTVTEIDSGCLNNLARELLSSLQQTEEKLNTTQEELSATKEELEKTTKEINQTRVELEQTKLEQNNTQEELEKTSKEKNQTRAELEQTKVELNTTQEELEKTKKLMNHTQAELEYARENPYCPLNSTVTSHWDLLYSDEFFGGVFTAVKLEVLRNTTKELEYFEGVRITDKVIEFFKQDRCPK